MERMSEGAKGKEIEAFDELRGIRERIDFMRLELYKLEMREKDMTRALQGACGRSADGHSYVVEKEFDYDKTRFFRRCQRCGLFEGV